MKYIVDILIIIVQYIAYIIGKIFWEVIFNHIIQLHLRHRDGFIFGFLLYVWYS